MSDAVYRLVLLAFPPEFRRRHAAAMLEQFRLQRRDRRGRPVAWLALWIRAIADGLRHGLALRFAREPRSSRSSSLPADLHRAWRSLMARRSTTALSIALLTLALAIATTVFGAVDALVLRPSPFPNVDRIVGVWTASSASQSGSPYMPIALARHWVNRTDIFEAVGAYIQGGDALVTRTDGSRRQAIQAFVTPGALEVLGVHPIAGRLFQSGEGTPGRDRLVVINESIWQERFNRDPAAIGAPLVVNGDLMTVVGVMPAWFRYPNRKSDLWRPLDLGSPTIDRLAEMIARTRAGERPAVLQDRLTAATAGILAESPQAERYRIIKLAPFTQGWRDSESARSLWLLLAATGLLVLTACANVASLTMARTFERLRDQAIQAALGASRWRLVRQALLEQALVGLITLALALPLAYAGLSAADSLLPSAMTFTSLNLIDVDARAITLLGTLAFGVPLLAGVVPAIAGSRASVGELLKSEGRSTTAGRGSRLFRQGLVVAEMACAVVLLVAGALLVTSFTRLQGVDRGLDTSALMYARLYYPTEDFRSPLSRRLHIDRVLADLPSMPGIAAVTLTSGVPPNGGQTTFGKLIIDNAPDVQSPSLALPIYVVTPAFFDVTGIAVLQGRPFLATDTDAVIVGSSLAAALTPGQSLIGRRIKWVHETKWREVVGVAAEIRSGGLDEPRGAYEAYYPLVRPAVSAVSASAPSSAPTGGTSGAATILIRVTDTARVATIREAIVRQDPRVMVDTVARVEDLYQDSLARQRLLLVLMLVFAIGGLALAAAGVYGVLSGLVSQRLREIGVRLMLGASPRAMSRDVLRGGLVLAGIGAVIGIVAAMALGRFMSSVLFEVRAVDATSYGVVALVMALSAISAAWRPARRAARVDPATLLRDS